MQQKRCKCGYLSSYWEADLDSWLHLQKQRFSGMARSLITVSPATLKTIRAFDRPNGVAFNNSGQPMFTQLTPAIQRKPATILGSSVAVHLLFLAWVLHSPEPIFVSPSSVMQGVHGAGLQYLYFPGRAEVSEQPPQQAHLTWRHPAKNAKKPNKQPPVSKVESETEIVAALAPNERPAGSPYGSLYYGKATGPEVRPALPIVALDPAIGSDLSNGIVGDVVVEVTIDEQGKITELKVVQSLSQPIDQLVLAAVSRWQFLPATRNGTPIASKQDVYYHFPR
jgi:protein TonB